SLFLSPVSRLLRSTLFPYTTLFRSVGQLVEDVGVVVVAVEHLSVHTLGQDGYRQAGVAVRGEAHAGLVVDDVGQGDGERLVGTVDRKSTRLNSSHVSISYADFFLKK